MLFSIITSAISMRFGEAVKSLGLCWGLCEANSVDGLVKEEMEKGMGDELREMGFEGQMTARGLGEGQTELGFGGDE